MIESTNIERLAYSPDDAADACGIQRHHMTEAIRSGALVARVLPTGNHLFITRYDLEIWLLGLDNWHDTKDARAAAAAKEEAWKEANAQAKSQERREAKAARAAQKAAEEAARAEEDKRLAADLVELDRLRELVHN